LRVVIQLKSQAFHADLDLAVHLDQAFEIDFPTHPATSPRAPVYSFEQLSVSDQRPQ
jgi:hypothetical protein